MINLHNLRLVAAALLFCLSTPGCRFLPPSKHTSGPHGQGYGTVALTYHRDMLHTYGHVELHYWNERGKRCLVWPTLSRFVPLGKDAVLFIGYLIDGPDDPYPSRRGPLRLLAAQGPGPVMDITDDVLLLWLKPTAASFVQELASSRIDTIKKSDTGILVDVFQYPGKTGTVGLTRDQLFQIMRETKDKGIRMKDPGLGTPYLKRDREMERRERTKVSETKQ